MALGVPLAFSVSYDLTTKAVTACMWAIPLVAAFAAVRQNATARLMVGGSLLLISTVTYAYSPRVYAVSAEGITVWRPIGNVCVPLADLREVRPVTGEDLAECIRLWSSGGLFGYDGYVADRSRIVVLVTAAQTALFSPDDPNGFARAIRAAATPAPVDQPREWPVSAHYSTMARQ